MFRILFLSLIFVGCKMNIAATDSTPNYAVIPSSDGKLQFHTGLLHNNADFEGLGEMHTSLEGCDNLPEEFDLRKLNVVSDIRNQGNCGSCWSFSQTNSLESAIMAGGGPRLDLAEQELVSNDKSNYGCNGGNLHGFKYQIEKGQALEADFPYTARTGSPKSGLKPAAKGVSYAYAGAAGRYPTEQELKCALYKSHTVPWITVSASNAWGNPPSSEKTVYAKCGHGQTNHAVGVVGWFKGSDGKTAFIMKNSWGKGWGDQGYMSLPLKCDSFGQEVAYIITDSMPCKPPVVKLPAEVQTFKDIEVMLGVKEQAGVDYTWFKGDAQIGKGATIWISSAEDAVLKLVGKTACGTSESSVRLKIIQ